MLSNNLIEHIALKLSDYFSQGISVIDISPIYGGSINNCYQIVTSSSSFFMKLNNESLYPEMFKTETQGLNLLREHSKFSIPQPLINGSFENQSFLIMEFISQSSRKHDFWETFGIGLGKLHQKSNVRFGLDHHNYIGSLNQQNNHHCSWESFFLNERIKPQLKLAFDQKYIDSALLKKFDLMFDRLEKIFPKEPPALIHGDLWNGNFMPDSQGNATIFDPAIYFGHREMDIAMTKLFGGFDPVFYTAYNLSYELEQGWEDRVDIANLYPLLVHVNLFGDGYLEQIKSIFKRFL